MKDYLNAEEIAHLEGIGKATVSRYIQEGLFEHVRKVAREWRIPLASYEKWRESTRLDPQREEAPHG